MASNSLNNTISSDQLAGQGKSLTKAGDIDLNDISGTIFAKFIEVAEAAIVLVIMFLIIHWVKKYIAKMETQHEQQRTALNVVEKLVVGFFMVIGMTIALKIVGIDISIFVGVGLLGLSYALKDIIQNYVAGILIFLKAPFKIGDIVKIKHYVGRVDKMEFQSTSLKTFDHRDITIYNSDIMSQSIENYSRHNMRRLEIDVSLGYGSDIQKITKIITKILENNPSVLKNPKFSIVFKAFQNNCLVVKVKFWVPVPSNFLSTRSEIAWQINEAFDESIVFGPYQRSFQAATDFSMNAERQNRIKAFYNDPKLTTETPPPAPPAPIEASGNEASGIGASEATPALNPDGTPIIQEVVNDIDEPQVDEDF